jgi:hypothetical protein
VKHLSADDSADARVKVGHRQANIPAKRPDQSLVGAFCFGLQLGRHEAVSKFGDGRGVKRNPTASENEFIPIGIARRTALIPFALSLSKGRR